MTKVFRILQLKGLGLPQGEIASSCAVSKSTVSKVLKKASELKIALPLSPSVTEEQITQLFLQSQEEASIITTRLNRVLPDFDYIRKELKRSGVTKKRLWTEYCAKCSASGQKPFMYSQFCYLVQQDQEKHRATMHIKRKPGEQVEVDWAGDPAYIVDLTTGELIKAYVFVAVSTFSLYTYAEAFLNQKELSWITAHNHMYRYFGGVAKILVPDNCKTAVLHTNQWYLQQLNPAYKEMAEHYNTVIIPARIRAPKDKPSVEGAVKLVSTQIIAALRNERFFSLAELNEAIWKKLDEFNRQPFQKKEGSRFEIFRDEELPLLAPLPATPYELAEWKKATVQYNYHIYCDGMLYSVPFEYIQRKVDVRLTSKTVKVFYNNNVIATHPRLYGRKGQYSTIEQHMPKEHQQYARWDGAYFRNWARKLGPNIFKVVDGILNASKIEQQAYRSCIGLLNLTKKSSIKLLEKACEKALSYTTSPSYKMVKDLLAVLQKEPQEEVKQETTNAPRGITRGPAYYKRGRGQ